MPVFPFFPGLLPRLGVCSVFFLFLFVPSALSAEAGAYRVSAVKPFSGLVRRGYAEEAARAEAESLAYAHAMRQLANLPEVRLAGESGPAEEGRPLDLAALARAVFRTRLVEKKSEGVAPDAFVRVTAELLPAPGDIRRNVTVALRDKALLELISLAVQMEESALSLYNELYPGIMALPPDQREAPELGLPLERASRRLQALDLYLKHLLEPRADSAKNGEAALAGLTEALALDSDNPLILTSLAEAYLDLDRAPSALEAAQLALEEAPWFARAYDVQGSAYLRLHLPALAAAAFARAVEMDPGQAEYFVHKASAHYAREEMEAMCRDLHRACGLGSCGGLEWARNQGHCLPGSGAPPHAPAGD